MKESIRSSLILLTLAVFTAPVAAQANAVENTKQLVEFWALKRFKLDEHKTVHERSILQSHVLAKAETDECFNGVGQPYPLLNPDKTCPAGQPKRNQAYVWGLTKAWKTLWFGTIANTHCLVMDSFLGIGAAHANPYWTCEFDAATSGTRDLRPPHIYNYNLETGALEDKSPTSGSPLFLIQTTIGFRSAGTLNGVVFLAGPSIIRGINIFAYDAISGNLLGAQNFPQWNDIRNWLSIKGVLYAGVGNSSVPGPTAPAGAIIRWNGESSTDPNVLFDFEVVGNLDSNAANLAEHDGRMYVSTWPIFPGPYQRLIGIYRSPRVPHHGFTAADADNWKKVWEITDYESDPVVAATTAGGALASYKGALYWGTMHVPFLATTIAVRAHAAKQINLDTDGSGNLDPAELLATALGTHRSISVFKGTNLGTPFQKIKVVYGEKYLPKYDPAAKSYRIAFEKEFRNRLHQTPTMGASGMGNFFNTYTWTMGAFKESLYIGTFDWSQLARVGIQYLVGGLPGLDPVEFDKLREKFGASVPVEGGDLFRLSVVRENGGKGERGKTYTEVEAESLSGVGNDTNYGIRTMLVSKHALYLGSANPMNLHPKGGFELLKLIKRDQHQHP